MPTRMPSYQPVLAHMRLNVSDLHRAVEFYTRFLRLHIIERGGNDFAFLSRSRAHHVVALFQSAEKTPPGKVETGVDHIAFEVRGRRAFARAYQTLTRAGVPVTLVNNGISWSIYFQDPSGNNLEIFRDVRGEPGGKRFWRGVRKPLEPQQILSGLRGKRR
ncbi:MAG TPA: VOC family protein [bacterium]